jgi:hypothetical protein
MSTQRSKYAALGFFLVLLSFVTMTGCGSGQPAAPTSTPEPTQPSAPALAPILMPTNTPLPTATIEPSPTSIPLPEGISDIVSNASAKYHDTFNYSFLSPNGWASCPGFETTWSAEDGHLIISAEKNQYGTVFYYADEMIDPTQAVYFLFAYQGNQNDFTLGFDGYVNGKVCDSNKSKLGFYSVALQHMPGLPLTVHTLTNAGLKTSYFEGDLILQELNWYGALMGFDQTNTFFIDIWKPGDPSQKLVFKQANPDFPKAYHFISWLAVTRKLMLDDFTNLTFDKIK